MILKEIHQSVETITGQPLSTIENKKLFCGLVREHDTTVPQCCLIYPIISNNIQY